MRDRVQRRLTSLDARRVRTLQGMAHREEPAAQKSVCDREEEEQRGGEVERVLRDPVVQTLEHALPVILIALQRGWERHLTVSGRQ